MPSGKPRKSAARVTQRIEIASLNVIRFDFFREDAAQSFPVLRTRLPEVSVWRISAEQRPWFLLQPNRVNPLEAGSVPCFLAGSMPSWDIFAGPAEAICALPT
jgi:hypothetical protein